MSVSLAGLGGEHFTGGGPLAIKLWAWPLSEGKGGASGAVAHAVTAMLLLSPVGLLPALPAGLAVLAVGRQVKISPPHCYPGSCSPRSHGSTARPVLLDLPTQPAKRPCT